MLHFEQKEHYTYADLLELITLLRSPDGCPWDQVQTHASILRNFIEETYEACEAIAQGDPAQMCEELGDVLTQVLFHTDIEREQGHFTMDDVCDGVCKKMVFRHAHLFQREHNITLENENANWEARKREEKGLESYGATLDAVSRWIPGLWRAEKIQNKAAKVGFTWTTVDEALAKLEEEVAELRQAIAQQAQEQMELGDVLFAAVGVARLLGIDPEQAIAGTCEKYIARFLAMEQSVTAEGQELCDVPRETLIALWKKAKEIAP